MKFNKYNSLSNLCEKHLTWALSNAEKLKDVKFVVTEKVHGANYMFCLTEGGEFKVGKRTSFLSEDSKFFGHRFVIEKYKESFIEKAKEFFPNKDVVLYGELYGGSATANYKPVQREVYYSDGFDFAGFDLRVGGEYLDYETLSKFSTEAEIPLAPLVAKDLSFMDAVNTNHVFDSLLSDRTDNVCEGVVISPATPLYMPNGDRIVFKNKNDAFKEKVKVPKSKSLIAHLTPEESEIMNSVHQYITPQRFISVISKMEEDEISFQNFRGLMNAYIADIKDETFREGKKISDHVWVVLERPISASVARVVREGLKARG